MGTRSGRILGWEKQGGGEEGYDQEEECDVGLGLRMQPNINHDTTSSPSSSLFPNRKSMEMSFHGGTLHPYHHYFTGDYSCGGSAVYVGNTSNQVAYPSLVGGATDCFPSTLKPPPKSLQHNHPLSLSGKMATSGNVRVPFTEEQWEELERQKLILKQMMASASPVPPELLLPIPTKSFPDVVAVPTSHHYPNRSNDPEPWRCRRTDGKKWRCSRDVAPHQKYCERHSHKNRPRSRKPVELPPALLDATKITSVAASAAAAATRRSLASQSQQPHVDSRPSPSSHFVAPYDQGPPSGFPLGFASPQPFDHPRCLDWFMKGETVPTSNSNQEWHHQHQNDATVGSKGDATVSRKNNISGGGSGSNIDPFQLKQSLHYSTPQHGGLFLMEGAVDPSRGQQTRRFIDAWSNLDEGSGNRGMSGYGPSLGKNDLGTSSLTLTMRGGEGVGDEYSNRMGEKPHWMNAGMVHHGSWMGSPPGGPLAEALCLGSIGGGGVGGSSVRYQTSPRGCSGVTTTTSSRSSSKNEGQEELNFIG